jgi:hypothetical protein
MRGKTVRGAWLLAAWLALLPATAWGQEGQAGPAMPTTCWGQPLPTIFRAQSGFDSQSAPGSPGYAPADPQLPLPLGSTRPEDGGLYTAVEALLFHTTMPLTSSQEIARRGFIASDNSLGFTPGTFVGSGTTALNVNNLAGQDSYQPGINLCLGWKFRDGSSVSLNWFFLSETNYATAATLVPRLFFVRNDFADSFLTAPVFNFPPEYGGPPGKIQTPDGTAGPFAAYGIWNGASIMTIQQIQRFQQWDITYRVPVIDRECYRFSGLVGPRFSWIWDRFAWRTTSFGTDSAGAAIAGPSDVALYTNIVSNRMYGAFIGCQQECYLGHGFACMLDTQVTGLIDTVKERAKYELEQRFQGLPENKRAKHDWSVVPMFSGTLSLQWYPTEFIQLSVGYQLMYFMNTIFSRRPIDFNYSNIAPHYDHINVLFDGFRAGIGFWF